MPYFLSPKVIFGKGALKRLSLELEGKGIRAALITDHTLKEKEIHRTGRKYQGSEI